MNKTYFDDELILATQSYMIKGKNICNNILTGLHKSNLSGFNIEFSEYK
jgi:hypothetical protein